MKKTFDPKNDIVFTPDNIADLMCQLAGVNKDSVVIDSAAGAGALLLAAHRAGAKKCIGIEFEKTIFDMLKENISETGEKEKFDIIAGDGLKATVPDDVNVVLSNPPYSFEDGGMNFAENLMKNMKAGNAVILTKENVLRPSMLEHSTLKAVIKMPDIFKGFASVQTAIYLFQCGRKHEEEDIVKFIDFSNDGYKRSGRKTQKGLLLDIPGEKPEERYAELIGLINGTVEPKYYKDFYVEDTIKEKKEWRYSEHIVIDNTPTEEDFRRTVADYLAYRFGFPTYDQLEEIKKRRERFDEMP